MANLQAEIHIIEGHRQFFLKASHFLEGFLFYHKAGCRHGA